VTSEEEDGGREFSAAADHGGALLDEGAEGREAGSRADADDGGFFRVGGEAEGWRGGADGDGEAVAGGEGGEVGGGYAEEGALAGEGGGVYDGVGEGYVVGVPEGGRGDGAVAS